MSLSYSKPFGKIFSASFVLVFFFLGYLLGPARKESHVEQFINVFYQKPVYFGIHCYGVMGFVIVE